MPNNRFPKLQILSNETHTLQFLLYDTDVSVANTLRRMLIADVPTLSIDLVSVHENTTCLLDEYLSHRLGLMPIRYYDTTVEKFGDASKEFCEPKDCNCEDGCDKCWVTFSLGVQFSDKATDITCKTVSVTSDDLKTDHPNVSMASFLNEEEEEIMQEDGIALVKLAKGQHLYLEAKARLGCSKEHAKWCPVAVATYRFIPEVYLNDTALTQLTQKQREQLVECCPDQILKIDDVTGQIILEPDFEDRATFTEDLHYLQESMKKKPEDEDLITVKQSESKFVFTVESTGCMHAQEIVRSALRRMEEKLIMLKGECAGLSEGV
ncbi:hypothetical protein TrLO_g13694 [Triparma laevis f. longispina]|uniref:DNA-directed RNA polymerase RpoA/D/Rpb3-type domain-containing protein n=1 Tax=Triparma laevis f. longispina TaxID=1714387 RepID=A0A9W7DXN3_9STRA|nr:hypothetical protein TrLO_g13694 [Triparma laevis f. longispina]